MKYSSLGKLHKRSKIRLENSV